VGKESIIAKKNSYLARCTAAAVSYNTPLPSSKMHKLIYNCSPGKYTKLFEKRRCAVRSATRKQRMQCKRRRLFPISNSKKDKSYGVNAQKPDMVEIDFLSKKEHFLKELELSTEDCQSLEADTRTQRDSAVWLHERRKRLTASFFGQICNKLPYTTCENIVKSSCSGLTPEDAIKSKKFLFFKQNLKNKQIEVNKRHKYFFQVQGQLQISNRKYCIFVLWTPLGVYTKKILREDEFWKKSMEPKLTKFYFHCLLPEIIDPRYPRSMKIRDPPYILDAQIKHKNSIGKNKISNAK
jgi:hypothetical protein